MTPPPLSEQRNKETEIHSATLLSRVSILRYQLKVLFRYLKFYWRVNGPAPRTPQGFQLHGNRHVIKGTFEPTETRWFEKLIPLVDGLVNVGANVGYYCCLALRQGKPVVAFEPVDLNVRYLLANIHINGWEDKFQVFPVCLGSEPGILTLYGEGTGASLVRGWANNFHSQSNLAPVHTLDQLLGKRISGSRQLILVDIEGAEYFFLQGAKNVLHANPKHWWIMEISIDIHWPNGETNPRLVETFTLFWDAGYEAWTIEERPVKIGPETIGKIQRQEQTLDCHNFMFFPAGERNPLPNAQKTEHEQE